MEDSIKKLVDSMPKARIQEGIDELFSVYFLHSEPSNEQKILVHDTVVTLKEFLKSI